MAGAATYAEGVALVLSALSLTRALPRVGQSRGAALVSLLLPRESEWESGREKRERLDKSDGVSEREEKKRGEFEDRERKKEGESSSVIGVVERYNVRKMNEPWTR